MVETPWLLDNWGPISRILTYCYMFHPMDASHFGKLLWIQPEWALATIEKEVITAVTMSLHTLEQIWPSAFYSLDCNNLSIQALKLMQYCWIASTLLFNILINVTLVGPHFLWLVLHMVCKYHHPSASSSRATLLLLPPIFFLKLRNPFRLRILPLYASPSGYMHRDLGSDCRYILNLLLLP